MAHSSRELGVTGKKAGMDREGALEGGAVTSIAGVGGWGWGAVQRAWSKPRLQQILQQQQQLQTNTTDLTCHPESIRILATLDLAVGSIKKMPRAGGGSAGAWEWILHSCPLGAAPSSSCVPS